MGKIVLEFNGDEEADDARTAQDGYKWKLAMWDLDQELRNTTKYGVSVLGNEEPLSETESKIAEIYRDKIRDILSGYKLYLD